jgi:predicted dithiol-disulfide oxidoreductase (DUF899 family)
LTGRLQAYKRRMGWTFPWASSHDSDYNFDLEISHPEEETRKFLAAPRSAATRATRPSSGYAATTSTTTRTRLGGKEHSMTLLLLGDGGAAVHPSPLSGIRR